MYSNDHSQVDWQAPPNAYPPQNSTSLPRKSSNYDPSNPVYVNFSLSPSPNNVEINRAALMRTPSPTPSEQKELGTGAIDWKRLLKWRFWVRREWLWYYVAVVIIVTITALVTLYHEEIVHWLTPVTRWLYNLKFGWLVPIGVLFVISFPPLFGHEIVAILCGLVWGLWIGFGIVAAGTFIGEVGNFYAFKYICKARGEKLEKSKISYACLAKVVRDGGFWVALIARYSAIPGHFTTAVFSTCGMGIIVFSLAAILSMPKQLITVYLGVILEQSSDDPNSDGGHDVTSAAEEKRSRLISRVVLALTVVVTVAAMWFILRRMNQAKPQVIYERRKARQTKLARASLYGNNGLNGSGSDMFTGTNNSLTDIPLAAPTKNSGGHGYGYGSGQSQPYPFSPNYQQSSRSSRNPGYGGNRNGSGNIVYAPKPRQSQADRYYSPENGYHRYGERYPDGGRDDHEAETDGTGYVAPGAAVVMAKGLGMDRAYDYTPTRQNSDGDVDADGDGMMSMGAQQEEYLKRYNNTGEVEGGAPRQLTRSPERMGLGPGEGQRQEWKQGRHMTSQSYSSLAYHHSQPQPLSPPPQSLPLSQSKSTPSYSNYSQSHAYSQSTPGQRMQMSYSQPPPQIQRQPYSPSSSPYTSSPTSTYPNNSGAYAYPNSSPSVPAYPETREIGQGQPPILTSQSPSQYQRGTGHHILEPTDASFVTAIDHGQFGSTITREPSLVESELHTPGAFPTSSSQPPRYTYGERF